MDTEDPLQAVHSIQRTLLNARPIANALCQLGMPAGEYLHQVLDDIDELAKLAATGICREAHERYADALNGSQNMLLAALAVAGAPTPAPARPTTR